MRHTRLAHDKNHNSIIIEMLGEKPVAFNPALARLGKSATAGLFLSQLLFWWNKGVSKDSIYKTVKEMEVETLLTRREQERAIRIWKEYKVLEVQLRGLPRKRHFKINISLLTNLLTNQYGVDDKLDSQFAPSITESTQRKNQKNNIASLKEAKKLLARRMNIRTVAK